MVSTEQSDLPQAPEVLKLVASRTDQPLKLAVAATVVRPGMVAVGDKVFVDDAVFDDATLDEAVLVDGRFVGGSVPAAER
jgi:hypothetical protein